MDFGKRTDAWAVRHVLSGHRNSFGVLVERYQSMVYHVALAHVGNPADAEDLTQDAFLKAFRSLNTLRDTKKFSAWIVTIVRNTSRDFLKRRNARAEVDKSLETPQAYEPAIEDEETRRLLWQHINQLEDVQRELLVLHHFEGKTARELAKIYGINTAACAKRLQRARQALGASLLKTLGVAAEDEKPNDLTKRILGLVATTPVAWESAAAATTTSALAAIASSGLMKGAAAILVIAAVAAGYALTNQETSSPSLDEQSTEIIVAQASFETDTSNPANAGSPPQQTTGNAARVVDTFSGRTHDPRNIGAGEIRGIVADAAENPVPGALVVIDGIKDEYWLYPDESESRQSQTTNANGEFVFRNLPAPSTNIATTYQVMAFTDDASAVDSTHFTHGGAVKEMTLHLQPSRTISGTVLDADNQPVRGARIYPVRTYGEIDDETFRGIALRTIADSTGRFALRGLQDDPWQLVVMGEGFAPHRTDSIEPGVDDLEIHLDDGGRVRGRLLDVNSGKGASGVQLTIAEVGSNGESHFSPWNIQLLTSGKDGYYEAQYLTPGPYRTGVATLYEDTYVIAENTQAYVFFDVESNSETRAPDFDVMLGGEVGGRVIDPETGEGLSNVQVTILINRTVAPAPAWSIMKTDAEGRYRFTGLRQGDHRIYLENQRQQAKSIATGPGEIVNDFDFVHTNSASIIGTVVDALGEPVSAATIQGSPLMTGNQIFTMTDADGRFEVRGLPQTDNLYLYASTAEFQSEPSGPITLESNELERISLALTKPRNASVEGIVVDSDGRRLVEARVHADAPSPLFQYGGSASTNSEGVFRIERLVEGDYTLQVIPREQRTWSPGKGEYKLTLRDGEAIANIRLLHPPSGASIAGRIVDIHGNPIAEAHIYASGAGGVSTQSDSNGEYSLHGLKNDSYTLTASHQHYTGTSLQQVSAGSVDANFVLEETGTITGQVLHADTGAPVEQFELIPTSGEFKFLPTQFIQNMGRQAQAFQSPEGSFTIENVAAGPTTLIAIAKGLAPGFTTIADVLPGEITADVVVRLQPGATVDGHVRDRDGNPIGGAKIVLGPLHNRSNLEHNDSYTLTQPDGSFTLDGLPHTLRILTVEHPNYAVQVTPLIATPELRYAPLDIVLERGGVIEGTLLVDGSPPAFDLHSITVEYPSQPDATESFTRADTAGEYSLKGVRPGNVRVRASFNLDGDYRRRLVQTVPAVIQEGQSINVDFNMTTGAGVVEGHVADPNDPPLGYSVMVTVETGGASYSFEARLDAEQHYRATGLPAGRVHIQYPSRANGYERFTHDLGVNESIRQDIELTGTGTIAYEVTQGTPNAAAVVLLLPGNQEVPAMNFNVFQTLFDQALAASGILEAPWRLRFRALTPGAYTLIAISAPNWTADGINAAQSAVATVEVGAEEVFVPFAF